MNALDHRLTTVERLASKGIRKVPLRPSETLPLPLWDLVANTATRTAGKKGNTTTTTKPVR